jgi:hypothetical protein
VSKQLTAWTFVISLLKLSAPPAFAADDAALAKDLTAVITSQGFVCAKVIKISKQADTDYLVGCQEGSNYEIVADAQGKLVAHPLGKKIH